MGTARKKEMPAPGSDANGVGQSQEYSAFLDALQADGLLTDATQKISMVNDVIVIDGKTMDATTAAKYLPHLKGVTNIEMEFK